MQLPLLLLLLLVSSALLLTTDVHCYIAPVIPNATYCDFEVIRRAESGGGSELLPPGTSVLDMMQEAERPFHDGPLMLGQYSFQWFNPEEVCVQLSTPPTTLVFVGDSITRHFMQGMQMLVRSDVKRGAMMDSTPDNVTAMCTCDLQFKMKACRQWLLRDTLNVSTTLPCPNARIVYIETSNDEHAEAQHHFIASLVKHQPRTLILFGGYGLHNRLLAKPVFKNLIHRTWRLLQTRSNVRVLCLGIHALQHNVPEQYRATFNNKKVLEYNVLMERLCRTHGIAFFDTFAITKDQTSFDGTHYELRVNVLKAQLLLNVIRQLQW